MVISPAETELTADCIQPDRNLPDLPPGVKAINYQNSLRFPSSFFRLNFMARVFAAQIFTGPKGASPAFGSGAAEPSTRMGNL